MNYTLKKSLGQHFLHDEDVCRSIVGAVTLKPELKLLEVGPGGGAITKYLLQLPDTDYQAIEVDAEKVQYLLHTYPAIKGRITEMDILKAQPPFEGRFSLIGNFPYNISSQIMFKVLEWEGQVREVVGMFQKEVAKRIAEGPGNKEYGILSVLMQAFYKVEYLFEVHENCFTPAPKVKSGVLRCTNTDNPYGIKDKKTFTRLVKAAFNQRRKMLSNALKGTLSPEAIAADPQMSKRAEQLGVEDFVRLYKTYLAADE